MDRRPMIVLAGHSVLFGVAASPPLARIKCHCPVRLFTCRSKFDSFNLSTTFAMGRIQICILSAVLYFGIICVLPTDH